MITWFEHKLFGMRPGRVDRTRLVRIPLPGLCPCSFGGSGGDACCDGNVLRSGSARGSSVSASA
jgi:hypothetical protein